MVSEMTERPSGDKVRRSARGWVVAIAPTAIALFALWFTAQTYFVVQRPYVGVVEINYEVARDTNNRPTGMTWYSVLKNTGPVPALITETSHVARIAKDNRTADLPVSNPSRGSLTVILMPNQATELIGGLGSDIAGFPSPADVLAGNAALTITIEVSYQPAADGWWRRHFTYRTKARFWHQIQSFIFESGFAN